MAILTVSQLNKYVNYYIRDNSNLKGIYVKGEIVNLKKHYASGHYYFSLKDNSSVIKCCMFASYSSKINFDLQDGMSVLALGDVGIYERDGAFQLYVVDIYPSGAGEEYLKYIQLKEKLEKKGYFKQESKKEIPIFPQKIATVTSSEGAALQDILNILGRRNPLCRVDVYSTNVQGSKSIDSICKMLTEADNGDADTVILARGGGASEDLSVFNSEEICDVIHNMKKPVITAIGHETDYTLSDYTSDLRAPTPSAAAELCSIPLSTFLDKCDQYESKISVLLTNKINFIENHFKNTSKQLEYVYRNERYSSIAIKNNELKSIINKRINEKISKLENKYNILFEKLNSNNISNILQKGYYIIYKDGKIILPEDKVNKDDVLEIVSQNKKLVVKVIEVGE